MSNESSRRATVALTAPSAPRLPQGFAVGLAVSAGFALVFVIAGLLLAAGLRPVLGALPWAAVLIGVALTGIDGAMVARRHIGLTVATGFASERKRGYHRAVLFGGASAVASLSCTVAVFLAIIGQALAASSVPRLLGVLLAYSAGAATVLVAVTVSTALARGALTRWVRRVLPLVGRLGGALLVVSGIYMVAYWPPQVVYPGLLAPQSVAAFPERASALLTAFVSGNEGAFALMGALLLGAGVVTAGGRRARRRRPTAVGEAVGGVSVRIPNDLVGCGPGDGCRRGAHE
jgi:cytochrome c-type biogenesis protein